MSTKQIIAFLMGMASVPAAGAPIPAQLRDHSVSIDWTDDRTIRDPEGQTKKRTQTSSITIYVSTAGRIFSRFNRSTSARDADSKLQVSSGAGDFLHWSFEGDALSADQHLDRGARRVTMSSAPVSPIVGWGPPWQGSRLRPDRLHRLQRPSENEIVSIAVTSTRCSVHRATSSAAENRGDLTPEKRSMARLPDRPRRSALLLLDIAELARPMSPTPEAN